MNAAYQSSAARASDVPVRSPFMSKGRYQNEAQAALNAGAHAYDLQKMALENEYAKEATSAANAYNDPSAVIARGRQAGLSPMAAMGMQGNGVSLSEVQDTPKATGSSSGQASGVGGMVDTVSSILGLVAPLFNLKADLAVKSATVEDLKASAAQKLSDAGLKEFDLNNIRPAELEGKEISNRLSRIQEAYQTWLNSPNESGKSAAQEKFMAELSSILQDTDTSKAQASLYDASAEAQKSIVRLNDSRVKTENILRDLTAEEKRLANGIATQELGILRLGGAKEKLKQLFIATEQMQSEANISQAKAATAVIREWVEIGSIGIEAASELLSVFLPSKAVSDIIASMQKKSSKIGFNY